MTNSVTRLAPSPTGKLHLGNALSFLLCWLIARSQGGTVYLRIDDLDPARSKEIFSREIIEDLLWLGLDWDSWSPAESIVYQSKRSSLYQQALGRLEERGLLYPCFCTRKELRSLAGAPHPGDEGVFYPGACLDLSPEERARKLQSGAPHAVRLQCPERQICFRDLIHGPQKFEKKQYGGDFPLMRSDGVWAYQLASTVDDGLLGINLVARGRDLLPSTPRQILLAELLGFAPPKYAHLPLLLDSNGERLAKRHAALSLQNLRERGVSPATLTGYLAYLAGVTESKAACAPHELLTQFRLENVKKEDIRISVLEANFLMG